LRPPDVRRERRARPAVRARRHPVRRRPAL